MSVAHVCPDRIPLVGTGPDLHADIDRWLGCEPVRQLIDAFDGDSSLYYDTRVDLRSRLELLDRFTDRWDARQGLERNQTAPRRYSMSQVRTVMAAAEALGFRGDHALRFDYYDDLVIFGGLVRACLARPQHGARLIHTGTIDVGKVFAVGGYRPFVADEVEQAAEVGLPNLAEEYAALDAGMRRAFSLGEPFSTRGESSPSPGGTWTVREYRAPDGTAVQVAAAPSSEPARRRANTADICAFFAAELEQLKPGDRVLIVGTRITVPPHKAVATRLLTIPHGVEVDAIGAGSGLVPGMAPSVFSVTDYLLEFRYLIRELRKLAECL